MSKWFFLSLIIVILDQLTKYFATSALLLYQAHAVFPGFNLTLMHNTGAAFSFLSQAGGWQRWFFIVLATLISFAIIVWMYNTPKKQRWLLAALAMVLGGAIGNLVDRVLLGYVVDFIEIYYQAMYWPAFNIADSAITAGAIMLLIDTFWFADSKHEN